MFICSRLLHNQANYFAGIKKVWHQRVSLTSIVWQALTFEGMTPFQEKETADFCPAFKVYIYHKTDNQNCNMNGFHETHYSFIVQLYLKCYNNKNTVSSLDRDRYSCRHICTIGEGLLHKMSTIAMTYYMYSTKPNANDHHS